MQTNTELADIVNGTAVIESLIDECIEAYCEPRDAAAPFFRSVLLHSSIIPLGAKVRVALAIAKENSVKLASSALHQVIEVRNAFAHHARDAHPTLVVKTDADEFHYSLHVIQSSGRIKRMTRDDALAAFRKAYEAAERSLTELRDQLGRRVSDRARR